MEPEKKITRKQLIRTTLAGAVAMATGAGVENKAEAQTKTVSDITTDDLKAAEKIAGIHFSEDERKAVLEEVAAFPKKWEELRTPPISYLVEPPTVFTPLHGGSRPNAKVSARVSSVKALDVRKLSEEDIAFLSVRELGSLIRARKISPVALTHLYLDRLKRYGDKLLCVITLTEELALRQAERAEKEIAEGKYRGPLHGIPCGVKDLFATKGIPTTWGAEPYRHQVFDYDAAVVEKLEAAGAILLAKLSMGALAQDDIWFKGKTKNPWNPAEGSSGSSAGSASAVSAGLVAFAIGTETLGSIISPSNRCRVTGLRPTYGRVSRYGAMGLSYTMDKIGPICREVEDCALVFAALCGADERDPAAVSRSFRYRPNLDMKKLKIGYLVGSDADLSDRSEEKSNPLLQAFATAGATVRPVRFTPAPDVMYAVLEAEAASAFDAFTRGPEIHELHDSNWPDSFRAHRYVPAVEYLQAQRYRAVMMQRFEQEFGDLDFFVERGMGWYTLTVTNLTGHPQVIIPNGVNEKGESKSISLVGRLYQEDALLAAARFAQNLTDFHHLRPDLSKL